VNSVTVGVSVCECDQLGCEGEMLIRKDDLPRWPLTSGIYNNDMHPGLSTIDRALWGMT
jgi:hypothetical protein